VEARLSRYAYLVSLFPVALAQTLGVKPRLRRRAVSSYTPAEAGGLLVTADASETRASMARLTGDEREFEAWRRFYAMTTRVARRLFPTLTEPLRSRAEIRRRIDDEPAWRSLFEEPLSIALERAFSSELVRGVVLTDATIGTFAPADDPLLRQNRCFLYHVIGNGTGRWHVPVGGMGALTDSLRDAALAAGARIQTDTEVVSIDTDGRTAELECAGWLRLQAGDVLAAVAPAVLARLTHVASDKDKDKDNGGAAGAPEGSQLKLNMLLRRLPRLRDPRVSPARAFAGTFHVNERYDQLQRAYEQALAGSLPSLPPCEVYCHSLTDPSILAPQLRAAGVHTLTLFGLHMPARLFSAEATAVKRRAVAATLRSLDDVLAEPIADCLLSSPTGEPCLEALTPPELEAELGMPGGHIFHRDLAWPYARSDDEVGGWGVETEHANVWLCGAGALRGGGVSGIPGHNAARAVLSRAGENRQARPTRASPPRRS
jgi:phytoene dehydrogenase-like protein